ncbi:hypothetical protein Q7C_1577 [Methylophaga frappieri]|jgi:hypothetical protein|uniref:Uncharacterized protein n=1 Tax=Methylophaga frappieri (strain ATCC BAA-2434 / DSM 25690 / JAM7) TaxID=754477 RepID=I1YII3_METFJ|nr:hypothetical protein [Methylophaga frappieri]AFJ02726.1 hypothetical protein Q7C_1577 [Methylophaga frappieri]
MDEAFSGVKYFMFDKNSIKTLWEEGIITECYRIECETNKLIRDDRLAYYITIELSDRHEISQREFDNQSKLAAKVG